MRHQYDVQNGKCFFTVLSFELEHEWNKSMERFYFNVLGHDFKKNTELYAREQTKKM